MTDLVTFLFKGSYAVSCNGRMLIYGLSHMEASLFCKIYAVDKNIPQEDKLATEALSPSDKKHKRRGRKLILTPYVSLIKSYVEHSPNPTTAELDQFLKREGASYSNSTAINNMLHRLGYNIPQGKLFRQYRCDAKGTAAYDLKRRSA